MVFCNITICFVFAIQHLNTVFTISLALYSVFTILFASVFFCCRYLSCLVFSLMLYIISRLIILSRLTLPVRVYVSHPLPLSLSICFAFFRMSSTVAKALTHDRRHHRYCHQATESAWKWKWRKINKIYFFNSILNSFLKSISITRIIWSGLVWSTLFIAVTSHRRIIIYFIIFIF